jgi:O-methyltransferase
MYSLVNNLKSKLKSYIKKKFSSLVKVHFDRQSMLHVAWGHVFNNHLRGDYWEFGVYRGDSLVLSYSELNKFIRWNKNQTTSDEAWRRKLADDYLTYRPKFIGFDTFESMPDNSEGNPLYASNTFQTTLPLVQKRTIGVIPEKDLFLVKGDFTKSIELPKSIDKSAKIAILNIDSDLYISAKSALDIAREYLQVGTVILFDEFHGYSADNLQGERLALTEFIQETGILVDRWFDYHYGGRAFLVTRI